MTKATIRDLDVLRLFANAFPGGGEAFEPVYLAAGPLGLRALSVHSSRGIVAQLVADSSDIAISGGKADIGISWAHLQDALKHALREGSVEEIPEVMLEIGDDVVVETRVGSSVSERQIGSQEAPMKKPQSYSGFDKAASASGIRADLAYRALTAFEGASFLDYIRLELKPGRVSFIGVPAAPHCALHENFTATQGKAATSISKGLLEVVSDPCRHGIQNLKLNVAVIDGGLSRFEYKLGSVSVTYWIAPIVAAD
jgi:hypothetical protein